MKICNFANGFHISNTGTMASTSGKQFIRNNSISSATNMCCDEVSFCASNATKSKKSILIDAMKNSISPAVKKKDVPLILTSLGFDISVDQDGLVTINGDYDSSHAFSNISFQELGVDENILFKKIKRISGNCSLNPSKIIKKTGPLESVQGDFYGANVKNYQNLRHIDGNAFFADDVRKFKISSPLCVSGTAYFHESLDEVDVDKCTESPVDAVSANEIVTFTL